MAARVIGIQWRPLFAVAGMMAVIAGAGISGAAAQNTPPQSSGCTSALISLAPCLGYITRNNSNSKPSTGCCSALGTVVKSSAPCLCQLFGSNNPLGYAVNRTQALSLPGACNVKTPPVSQCAGAAGVPATNPAASPGSGPVQSRPSITPASSKSGNIPVRGGKTADGSNGGTPTFAPSVMGLLWGLILVKVLW